MNRIAYRVACTVFAVLFVSVRLVDIAQAEWTVTYLNPSGSAYGVHDGQQVGLVSGHASLWSGTAESWVNLNPDGATYSTAQAVHNGVQVGMANERASLWTGTAESYVDLHPDGAIRSDALGVHDGQQVGWVNFTGEVYQNRASLWSGTAESYIDLHPRGASKSHAYGVHDGQQVGSASFPGDGGTHAVLWSGTAESWVDLGQPPGAQITEAYAVHNGQQVGGANFNGQRRASLWTGTAESWVDLHPNGASESLAHGVYNGQQVGWVDVDGRSRWRASLWTGTAESWEDLSLYLTGSWASTQAWSTWNDETTTYVVGFGQRVTGSYEALLWTRPIARLPGDFDNNRVLDEADLNRLAIEINGNASDLLYDINGDGKLNTLDRGFWIGELRGTWFGDANLDGVFSTADLVQVLARGKFEDPTTENVLWSEGDWNGDLQFNSADLVAALADGGYEAGPRPTASAVPEPTCLWLLLISLFALRRRRR